MLGHLQWKKTVLNDTDWHLEVGSCDLQRDVGTRPKRLQVVLDYCTILPMNTYNATTSDTSQNSMHAHTHTLIWLEGKIKLPPLNNLQQKIH